MRCFFITLRAVSTRWNNSPEQSCTFRAHLHVWVCNWHERSPVVFLGPYVPRLGSGCDTTKFDALCTDHYSPAIVGSMSQWGGSSIGAARSVEMSQWPGVAGLGNTGWYWRSKAPDYGVDGAPSRFYVDNSMQLGRGEFVVLAVAYPTGATLKVSLQSTWWAESVDEVLLPSAYASVISPRESISPDTSLFRCPRAEWWSFCSFGSTGGVGPAYAVADGFLFLRIVNPACYNKNTYALPNCGAAGLDGSDSNSAAMGYEAGGISVPNVFTGFRYKVEVQSCVGCTVQSKLDTGIAGEGVITFYEAPDAPPLQRFRTDFGPVRSAPPAQPGENVVQPTCSAPSNKAYDPNQKLDPLRKENPAVLLDENTGQFEAQRDDISAAATIASTMLFPLLLSLLCALRWLSA